MITPVHCPLCQGSSRELFARDGIEIRECAHCGHQFADVEPDEQFVQAVYGDDYFQSGRAGYPDYLRESSILRRHGQRYGRLVSQFQKPGRMLDVGAAAGFILGGFQDCGWTGVGIEPNSRMAEFGRRELGLEMVTSSFESVSFPEPFDLISCIQVLAHFPDPVAVVGKIHGLVRPGGMVLIETWDRESRVARLFGQHWHEYSPPSVLHYFGRSQVRQLMGDHGFEFVAAGRPSKWISGAHAKSLVGYKLAGMSASSPFSRPLLWPLRRLADWVPDRLPIPYPSFDLAWFLFRRPATSRAALPIS